MAGRAIGNRPSDFRGTYQGCWEWSGYRVPAGYGRVQWQGKQQSVHRLAWEAIYGPIENGLWVLHHCDNPPCFRWDHLFLGTPSDNTRDALNKGRLIPKTGSGHGGSKLTEEDVEKIRSLYSSGKFFQKDLAEKFGVTRPMISLIVTHRNWK